MLGPHSVRSSWGHVSPAAALEPLHPPSIFLGGLVTQYMLRAKKNCGWFCMSHFFPTWAFEFRVKQKTFLFFFINTRPTKTPLCKKIMVLVCHDNRKLWRVGLIQSVSSHGGGGGWSRLSNQTGTTNPTDEKLNTNQTMRGGVSNTTVSRPFHWYQFSVLN